MTMRLSADREDRLRGFSRTARMRIAGRRGRETCERRRWRVGLRHRAGRVAAGCGRCSAIWRRRLVIAVGTSWPKGGGRTGRRRLCGRAEMPPGAKRLASGAQPRDGCPQDRACRTGRSGRCRPPAFRALAFAACVAGIPGGDGYCAAIRDCRGAVPGSGWPLRHAVRFAPPGPDAAFRGRAGGLRPVARLSFGASGRVPLRLVPGSGWALEACCACRAARAGRGVPRPRGWVAPRGRALLWRLRARAAAAGSGDSAQRAGQALSPPRAGRRCGHWPRPGAERGCHRCEGACRATAWRRGRKSLGSEAG